ncbi:MAG: type II/IV secretion system protein [Verrucomicrobia bacterium]|nr:type II/IV secretion system protein [Verrucomicrobiota bacterium]
MRTVFLSTARNTVSVASDRNDSSAAEISAPRTLESLVRQAERAGASDIHLHMLGKAAQVAFRLDGLLTPVSEIPEPLAERVVGRIKFLARLKTYQELLPQDGRIDKADLGAQNDLRVATYPTVTGEKIVLRLFDQGSLRTLDELGFPADARTELETFLHRTAGLLLLTGPAGSGKTTTIYACLRQLAECGGRHIITVEDPVEQIIPGLMQTEVSEPRGLTFAKAARHLLRQDPQVLVIGEIRDEETANIAVRAALTGHLVISTLHAGSCKGVFERLLVMCADLYAVVSSAELVLNQRLVRRLCAACGGDGCEACLHTGYKGRVPVVEWCKLTDTLRQQISAQGPDVIQPQRPLAAAARQLVHDRVTNEAEYRRLFSP